MVSHCTQGTRTYTVSYVFSPKLWQPYNIPDVCVYCNDRNANTIQQLGGYRNSVEHDGSPYATRERQYLLFRMSEHTTCTHVMCVFRYAVGCLCVCPQLTATIRGLHAFPHLSATRVDRGIFPISIFFPPQIRCDLPF